MSSNGFTFQKATRRGALLRLALCGPSGSGKTWTALKIAQTFGLPSVVLDTERGSASLYADQFNFDAFDFKPPYDPRRLVDGMNAAAAHVGRGFVIVDSLSHFWFAEGGLLDLVDEAAKKTGGNSFAAWKTGTPVQNSLLETMIGLPCHLIVTMRSKQEYVLERDEKTGKSFPKKVGMAPVQRDGIEYEFTVTADLNTDHDLIITKTRCSAVADKLFRAGKADEFAGIMKDWLAGASSSSVTNGNGEEVAMRKEWAGRIRSRLEYLGWTVPEDSDERGAFIKGHVLKALELPADAKVSAADMERAWGLLAAPMTDEPPTLDLESASAAGIAEAERVIERIMESDSTDNDPFSDDVPDAEPDDAPPVMAGRGGRSRRGSGEIVRK